MRGFSLVWFGQIISLMGTGMTQFALTIWAWDITGSATAMALVGVFNFAPTVILSPVAGALVDRWNRKAVMMISDLAAGLATISVLILYSTGQLQMWHLYIAGAFTGAFQAFQFPAYSAAISLMVSKDQYTRANAMLGLAESASQIGAPFLAGVLITLIRIDGIMIIDVVTFVFALAALALVSVPQPAETEEGKQARGSLLQDSVFGFRYILARPSLLGLQLTFFMANLFASFSFALLPAMILARTSSNEFILGVVQTVMGVGGVVGGVVISAWGGFKQRVHGVLLGMALSSLFGTVVMGFGQEVIVWSIGGFMSLFFIPLINGSNQGIWQAKVPPDLQGRVFGTRRLIAQITAPLAAIIAGPLADNVLEPAMQPGGSLAPILGPLLGVGDGAGMAIIFVVSGLLGVLAGLGGYAFRIIRDAEKILPDHAGLTVDQAPEVAAAPAESTL
jgi:MFS family permease